MVVLKAFGDIAVQQAELIATATWLMLLIIVPVIALTLFFAFRYRHANTEAKYEPEWDHSTKLEVLIWGAPLAIILVLGTITWISTHKLDPYRPLDRIDAQRAVAPGTKPLRVDVVAMDWKWLFVYPEEGVATVNELAAPVDRPIEFHLTASTVMNAFYVPALAGMVYAMPGMETKLNAVINHPGVYQGMSANYSGAGFSDMHFRFIGMSDADFKAWVEDNKATGQNLDRIAYLKLEKPSQREPVRRFANVDDRLYEAVLNRCVDDARMCSGEMMAIDARGGAGKGAIRDVTERDTAFGRRTVVAAMCTPKDL